ncbi:MAG: ASPIC/UnbV domain-containing protein [Planctomycetota bacterium]|nr:ASPIC/UnbV domain-containing protein [Planctomycetota bacterium]
MRNDFEGLTQLGAGFATVEEQQSWKEEQKDISNITHPFSGSERNRLFLSSHGDSFLDISGISGVDSSSDGRVSVWLDFDRDGRSDLAVVNSNRPLLQFYRNATGDAFARLSVEEPTESAQADHRNFIALKFVGGNDTSDANPKLSNRDGWGARVTVEAGSHQITREHLCGQGFAGQSSATMLIGLGEADSIDRLIVDWPSGIHQEFSNVAVGQLVTLRERPQSDSQPAMTVSRYETVPLASAASAEQVSNSASKKTFPMLTLKSLKTAAGTYTPDTVVPDTQIVVLTTMASWCTACARHQPILNRWHERMSERSAGFKIGGVSIIGLAGDPEDSVDDLDEFIQEHEIKYSVVTDPDAALRTVVASILNSADGADILPSTIVLTRDGQVLKTHSGIPTVSELRQLIFEAISSRESQ